MRNTDPDILTLFVNALLYITGEENDLPQCPKLTIHSDILPIGWLYIILGFIPKYLTHTYHTYLNNTGSKKTGPKWASQIITQILKLIYGQFPHHSKIKHAEEALDDNTKELILDSKITYEHGLRKYTLPYHYNPYFGTPLSSILDTSITA